MYYYYYYLYYYFTTQQLILRDYIENIKDVILKLRRHTSLIIWCSGNELYPKSKNPSKIITDSIKKLLLKLDPDRFFIPSSMAPQNPDFSLFDPFYAFAPQDGPYGLLYTYQWYNERNPGLMQFINNKSVRYMFVYVFISIAVVFSL